MLLTGFLIAAFSVSILAKEAKEEKLLSKLDQYPPEIKFDRVGQELRITVTPNKGMGADRISQIQAVRLDDIKGEFLGSKAFRPKDKDRIAEFMFDPKTLKIQEAKVTVHSAVDGTWTKIISLKMEKEPAENPRILKRPTRRPPPRRNLPPR